MKVSPSQINAKLTKKAVNEKHR
ncbi:MAG: hypothetical protein O7C02_00165 [Rickettsia endosymbiont of Ixodes persulcatus]|nr:hypothetical protein [Rickettsia endosymbiont of Ixodes persulcatus]